MRYRSGAPAEVQAEETGPRNGIEKLTSMSYVPPRVPLPPVPSLDRPRSGRGGPTNLAPLDTQLHRGADAAVQRSGLSEGARRLAWARIHGDPDVGSVDPGSRSRIHGLGVRDSSISFRTRATRESRASCSRVSGSSSCGFWPQGALRRPRRNRPHACSTNRTSLTIPRLPLWQRTSCCSTSSRRRTGRDAHAARPLRPGSRKAHDLPGCRRPVSYRGRPRGRARKKTPAPSSSARTGRKRQRAPEAAQAAVRAGRARRRYLHDPCRARRRVDRRSASRRVRPADVGESPSRR